MSAPATRRCFIGLALDESTRVRIHESVRVVLDPDDWRLHAPEDLHLTLCFLGETSEARIPSLRTALRAELEGCAIPRLTIQGVGSFGDPEAPRVLWAGVNGTADEIERLLALRRASARALETAALRWDSTGSFTPHLTVARPRRGRAAPAAFHALALDVPWQPAEGVLFTSVPGARPHYPKIESFPLGN